jgi:hypothetical protein
MNDSFNSREFIEDIVESFLVGNIKRDEVGPFAANQFNPSQDLFVRVVEAVDNDDFISSFKQR